MVYSTKFNVILSESYESDFLSHVEKIEQISVIIISRDSTIRFDVFSTISDVR